MDEPDFNESVAMARISVERKKEGQAVVSLRTMKQLLRATLETEQHLEEALKIARERHRCETLRQGN